MVNNGRMIMQTDLDLNGHSIYQTINFSSGAIGILKEINMNNQKITNLADGINDNDAVNKKQMEDNFKHMVYGEINIGNGAFSLFGYNEIIIPYRLITSIFFVYKTYNSSPDNLQNLPRIGIKITAGNVLNLRAPSNGLSQTIEVNQTMTGSLLKLELTSGPVAARVSVDKILVLIELAFHN